MFYFVYSTVLAESLRNMVKEYLGMGFEVQFSGIRNYGLLY